MEQVDPFDRYGWPKTIDAWSFYSYEWIDDLSFMPPLSDHLHLGSGYDMLLVAIRGEWQRLGWEGDGELQIVWLPPFCFPDCEFHQDDTMGRYLLHVKQLNDGISWIASPVKLPWLERS